MKKQIITLLLAGTLSVSMVACTSGNNESDKADNAKETIEETNELSVQLKGKFNKDYTRDELSEMNDEITERIENTCVIYGLEEDYETEEKITEENGLSVNDNYIYLDIENTESNRLESMYYGFKQYGSDLASGQLIMKLGFNLDNKAILKDGEFSFAHTSMSTFSEAFTGREDRDYTKLNKQIYEIIKSGDSFAKIENNLYGALETITITDGYLLYKIETKEYDFKNIDNNL